jgi:sugar phosphate isomerase/epimerase
MRRRTFLRAGAMAAAATLARPSLALPASRRFTINLVAGMIGVVARTQAEVNALAKAHGFESVEARGAELAAMSADELARLKEEMQRDGLVWGAGFLPNDARADAPTFTEAIKGLPAFAAGLQRAGVTRVGTWISPGSDDLTYLQNYKRHVERVGLIAGILDDYGIRFGLEYIGTPALRRTRRFAFIHSMTEARELFADVGAGNLGFVLDSWHWWTAKESLEDLRRVRNRDVVAVDLNDAPAGIPIDDQKDNQRELPAATGVIPVDQFVQTLVEIGYDGPVRAEPFNATLNALENDEACARTIDALRRALGPATRSDA